MIRIAISVEAFAAIARTMPLGSVGVEPEVDATGQRLIWLEPQWSTASGPCAAPARATAM